MAGMARMAEPLGIPHTRMGSGTSWIPDASPIREYTTMTGAWMLMAHGSVVDVVEFTAIYPAGTADATTTYAGLSTCGCGLPTVSTRFRTASCGPVCVDSGDVSVIP